ncbi:MAG: hypothetical protein IT563_12035 [Alphaproteobacteria bacterium]|nr:hypothetical protein [Alphaproteobacteria bacterium]
MAFKPNYNLARADRNRAKQARRDEKLRKKLEASELRKAAQNAQPPATAEAEPGAEKDK